MSSNKYFLSILSVVLSGALLSPTMGHAEEGMWTFDNPPRRQLEEKYGFSPTQKWLDHVRLASVRFNDGGSGSFVSPHGLVLTNHHVARGQLQKMSTASKDYVRDGFYAATQAEEIKAPDLEINVLVSLENVTERVQAALAKAKTPEAEYAARETVIADIERESQNATGLRSDVVSLYQGGEYWIYRYKKFTDVRLVFAPEEQIAFFGGSPDNFTYPRYDLDMAIFRVYENGKPIESKEFLRWNPNGAHDDDLVFVSGNPGSTQRQDTVAELTHERDVVEPNLIKIMNHRIEALQRYSAEGAEQARQAGSQIFNLENSLKAYEGRLKGLLDPNVMAKKDKEEDEFRARVASNPEWKTRYGAAWTAIAEAENKADSRAKEMFFHGLDSQLANIARTLVEYAVETRKTDGQRLPGYHDAQLESLRFQLASPAPIYKKMEMARIAAALQLDLDECGPEDPFLKAVLNGRTVPQAATELVNGTKLEDPSARKKLMEGGEAAIASSNDSMIVLARKLDPSRREFTKWMEDTVESVILRAGEDLGKARFAVYGKTNYPDANFTLRLSYGQVKGYPMNGTKAPSETTLYGLYDRASSFSFGQAFNLPARFKEGRGRLTLATPLNFVTTNDIIGGNSGSPVINCKGEIVGLIFDGNIESLVGDFVYDGAQNRAIAVHPAGMTEVLKKLYGAEKLVDELSLQRAP